jgi:hypothetical protein
MVKGMLPLFFGGEGGEFLDLEVLGGGFDLHEIPKAKIG